MNTQPNIMAIGESVRSLSFLPSMAQHSAPMQVAAALGMTMVAPMRGRSMRHSVT